MKRHYVITVTSRERWRWTRSVSTRSGTVEGGNGWTEEDIYDRIYKTVVEEAGFDPNSACVLFYRLEPLPCATLEAWTTRTRPEAS